MLQVFGKSKQVKHVAIFMNQPSPPHQGPWRVLSWQSGKSPGFYKIQKYTWHHFAKFKNILPPHLPLNLYKIRGRGGSQLGRVGRVQVFGKSKQVKHVAIFMNQPSPPHQGPWRVLSWQSGKSPGFYKIQKYTWHHFAKFKNILSPSPPTQSLQNQGLWRVPAWKGGKGPSFWKIQTGKACGHIHESAFPTTSGPLEGPILAEWEESWFLQNLKIHLASLCQIQEYPSPSPPTQSLQNQGPWRVPAWKGGKGPSFWKIQTGISFGHIHESA